MKNTNDTILKTIIKITGVDAINSKKDGEMLGFNIIADNVKYAMWLTKKDGSQTKASQQYTANGYGVGHEVGIAYKEEENEYEYTEKGTGEIKKAKSMNRTILWFAEASKMEEYVPKKPVEQVELPELTPEPELPSIDVSKIPF